jgi:hypothetical protein
MSASFHSYSFNAFDRKASRDSAARAHIYLDLSNTKKVWFQPEKNAGPQKAPTAACGLAGSFFCKLFLQWLDGYATMCHLKSDASVFQALQTFHEGRTSAWKKKKKF